MNDHERYRWLNASFVVGEGEIDEDTEAWWVQSYVCINEVIEHPPAIGAMPPRGSGKQTVNRIRARRASFHAPSGQEEPGDQATARADARRGDHGDAEGRSRGRLTHQAETRRCEWIPTRSPSVRREHDPDDHAEQRREDQPPIRETVVFTPAANPEY